jgi:hypothetical protein
VTQFNLTCFAPPAGQKMIANNLESRTRIKVAINNQFQKTGKGTVNFQKI